VDDTQNIKVGDKIMKIFFVKSLYKEINWLILCVDRKKVENTRLDLFSYYMTVSFKMFSSLVDAMILYNMAC